MVNPDQLDQAAQAVFEFRVQASQDNDPGHRHPMMYGGNKWHSLPQSEKTYYYDMLKAALMVIGIQVSENA
jgi:hypothetical protein